MKCLPSIPFRLMRNVAAARMDRGRSCGWSGGLPLDPLAMTSEHRAGFDWWSLQPLKRVSIPVSKSRNARHPIDDFIAQKLDAKNLTMSPEAERRVLIRRSVRSILLGLPPSPEEVDQFMRGMIAPMRSSELRTGSSRRLITVNAGRGTGWTSFDLARVMVSNEISLGPMPGRTAIG